MSTVSIFDDDDPTFNSLLGFDDDQMSQYISGYEKSVELLLSHVVQTREGLDYLIYPIMFNYRQYLELSIKHINWLADQILDRRVIANFQRPRFVKFDNSNHNLGKIWQSAVEKLKKVDDSIPDSLLKQVGKTVDDYQTIDKSSMSFRYPENKDWERSINKHKSINILIVVKSYEATIPKIRQIDGWLHSMIETWSTNG